MTTECDHSCRPPPHQVHPDGPLPKIYFSGQVSRPVSHCWPTRDAPSQDLKMINEIASTVRMMKCSSSQNFRYFQLHTD